MYCFCWSLKVQRGEKYMSHQSFLTCMSGVLFLYHSVLYQILFDTYWYHVVFGNFTLFPPFKKRFKMVYTATNDLSLNPIKPLQILCISHPSPPGATSPQDLFSQDSLHSRFGWVMGGFGGKGKGYSRCWKSEQLVGWKGLLHWKLEYIAENSENQRLEDDDIHFRIWNGPFLRGNICSFSGRLQKGGCLQAFGQNLDFTASSSGYHGLGT